MWKLNKIKLKPAQGLRILIAGVIGISFLLTLGYLVWAVYVKPQPQVISGINLRRQPVVVEFLDQKISLDMFDTFHRQIEFDGTLEIKVFSRDGQLIETRRHDLGQQAGILMELYVESSDLYQCVIQANRTATYYDLSQKDTVRIINPYPGRSFYTFINRFVDRYVYLDTYGGQNLPSSIDNVSQVWGYYFVPCSDVGDNSKIQAWLSWWQGYNSQTQRDLYQKEIDRINASTTYK